MDCDKKIDVEYIIIPYSVTNDYGFSIIIVKPDSQKYAKRTQQDYACFIGSLTSKFSTHPSDVFVLDFNTPLRVIQKVCRGCHRFLFYDISTEIFLLQEYFIHSNSYGVFGITK